MRESWTSKIGFIWAAIGSAIGLGSIWRFPYLVGENGGAWFVLFFVFFLLLFSFPTFLTEAAIGRFTQKSPSLAFEKLGKTAFWKNLGLLTIITGFIVSAFYGVVCSWTLKYLFSSLFGITSHFPSFAIAEQYFIQYTTSIGSSLLFLAAFFLLSTLILYFGVRRGIESFNQYFMPLLFVILLFLAIKGLLTSGGIKSLPYLFSPHWEKVHGGVILEALGQAFFGVSIGQGTLITYGSYLSRKDNLLVTALPVFLAVIFVSLLAGICIFSFVFAGNMSPTSGPSLMFLVLPAIFSTMPFGYILSLLFFTLIFLAGFTSQISAMEPAISFFIDGKKLHRKHAAIIVGAGSFLLACLCNFSFAEPSLQIYGSSLFQIVQNIAVNFLIPLGAFFALILVGWKMTTTHRKEMYDDIYHHATWLQFFIRMMVRYVCSLGIFVVVFYGIFG